MHPILGNVRSEYLFKNYIPIPFLLLDKVCFIGQTTGDHTAFNDYAKHGL